MFKINVKNSILTDDTVYCKKPNRTERYRLFDSERDLVEIPRISTNNKITRMRFETCISKSYIQLINCTSSDYLYISNIRLPLCTKLSTLDSQDVYLANVNGLVQRGNRM